MSGPAKGSSLIHEIDATHFASLQGGIDAFLDVLEGPTRIKIPGEDNSRCRIFITLLHGNEPSGMTALLQLLQERLVPVVDVHCYLIATEAANTMPRFSCRQVPGKRDYNRCFKPPYDIDDQGPVCRQLQEDIIALSPEAVVDMHNTSGEGPAFGVITRYDRRHDNLVSLFTDRVIVTDLRLGAIMETSTENIPVVTIECGGAFESAADRLAYTGLKRYFSTLDLYALAETEFPIDKYEHPLRVELSTGSSLSFGEFPIADADVTLKTEIEHHNFGEVTRDTLLGWVKTDALHKIRAYDSGRNDHFKNLYRVENGELYPRENQKLFMITSDPVIAKSDCLWYVTRSKN